MNCAVRSSPWTGAFHEIRLREVERGNAELEAKVKKAELKAVEVEIDRREVKSPLDGIIVERLKHEGEWVQPGETMFKIVGLKRLRVEGTVPANKYSRDQVVRAHRSSSPSKPPAATRKPCRERLNSSAQS